MTEDPAKDGLTWYVYCGNNPVGKEDLSGLSESNDDSLNMSFVDKLLLDSYTDKYNEVYHDTLLKLEVKYARLNTLRRSAVEIRRKYNHDYQDNYDYTYGGVFVVDRETEIILSWGGLTQKETDENVQIAMGASLKPDIKQINQVASKMGITGVARKEFGDYIESLKKHLPNNRNFTWKELIEIAKEFKGQ